MRCFAVILCWSSVAVWFLSPPPIAAQDAVDVHRAAGQKLLDRADYDGAVAKFSEALGASPRDTFSLHQRGVAWAQLGEFDKALADCNEAIRVSPTTINLAHSHFARGVVWAMKGAADKAALDFQNAVRHEPKLRERVAAELKRSKSKKLLLIGQGPDGHPAASHEFMAGVTIVEKCLKLVEGLEIKTVKADEPWTDGPKLLADADGVVLYLTQGAEWMQNDPRRYDAFTRFAARGGGIVALHWAVGAKDAKYIDGQLKLLGGTRGGPQRKYQILDADLKVLDAKHPILAGVKDLRVNDELYYRLDFAKGKPEVQPLLSAKIDGRDETVGWSWERADGGRSFGFVGMHFHHNWKLVEYRRLAAQAALWTLKMKVPEKGLAVDVDEKDLELRRK